MRLRTFLLMLLLTPAILLADDAQTERDRTLVDQSYLCLRTLGDLRSARTSLEAYLIDHGSFPDGIKAIEQVQPLVEPGYIRTLVLRDAWGTPFRIRVAEDGRSFVLASAGSDRVFDEASWSQPGLWSDSTADAVLTLTHERDREWVIQR